MHCTVGFKLHHQYQSAETEKLAISRRRLISTPENSTSSKEVLSAKQRYVETYADWLGHKAFCLDCKPKA